MAEHRPLRSNYYAPTTSDAEAVKRYGFHDQGLLVCSIFDSRLSWDQREILKQVGEKLYGKRAASTEKQGRAVK